MRIVVWFFGVVGFCGLHVLAAALRDGGRGSGGGMIFWSPLVIAYLIDRAIIKGRAEKAEIIQRLTEIQSKISVPPSAEQTAFNNAKVQGGTSTQQERDLKLKTEMDERFRVAAIRARDLDKKVYGT